MVFKDKLKKASLERCSYKNPESFVFITKLKQADIVLKKISKIKIKQKKDFCYP